MHRKRKAQIEAKVREYKQTHTEILEINCSKILAYLVKIRNNLGYNIK